MRRAAAPTLITVLLSAAAVLGYLSYRWYSADRAAPATPETTVEGEAPALADNLPEFVMDDLDGIATSLATWQGKPLLINFWATWCAPCLREIPMLKEFQAEHDWLQVIGIAVDRRDPVLEFAADMQFNYPVLVGQAEGMEAAASFGVDFFALPFTVFASADGRLLGVHTGEIHAEHLENLVAVLEELAAARIDTSAARARIAGFM